MGKPLFRVHTAGSVGGSTAIVAASHVESGVHERVLTIGWQQQSVSEAMWALSFPIPFQQQLVAGAGGYFAPFIREYMRRSERSGRHRHPGGAEGPAQRAEEPVRAPARARHHLRLHQGVVHAVGADPLRRDVPVLRRRHRHGARRREPPPRRRPRRRACRRRGSTARRCAPSRATAAGRDQVHPRAGKDCAADVFAQAGITDPRGADGRGRDVRAVLLVRADVAGEPRLRRRRARAGG